MMSSQKIVCVFWVSLWGLIVADAFAPSFGSSRTAPGIPTLVKDLIVLQAASDGQKKKKRRRKEPAAEISPEYLAKERDTADSNSGDDEEEEVDLTVLAEVAKFEFVPDDDITKGVEDNEKVASDTQADSGAIPLPDIKQVLRKKFMEEELSRIEEEQEDQQVKIKRTDRKALLRLLEQDPYADADDSFFEEEEYGTISALLGERAKPFLSIPTGPLQVGHFIGALVIVLMAFIEYPGFPLTNLPTPLRGALQGGLLTVYLINAVMAFLALGKASERGQSSLLWAVKTFSVGGIAYDQLTQLPTLEAVEKAKGQKGKRALKNRK